MKNSNYKKSNNHNSRKILITMITVIGILFSVAGCTGRSGEDDGNSFIEQFEALDNPEAVNIKFLFPGAEPKSWPSVKAEIEKRCRNELNISLDFRWLEYEQYMDTVNILNSSGEVYDAFITGRPDGRNPDFTRLAREGRLKDITELFPSSAPSLYNMYTGEELEFASVDGRLYAVPSLYKQAFCPYVLADDALLKKYSISDISTYNEYGEFLKTIKENEPDMIPGINSAIFNTLSLFAATSGYVIADESARLVYKWDDPDMKLIPWEKTPEFYEMVSYIVDWHKNGYLALNTSDTDLTKTASVIYVGMLAPPPNGTSTMAFSNSGGQAVESNPLRSFFLYDKYVQRSNPMGTFYINGSFVFPAASRDTDKVLRFLEWVQQSRDNYLLMVYGIENRDYIMLSGNPVLPSGMDISNSSYMHWDGSWAFKNSRHEFSSAMTATGEALENPFEFIENNSKHPPHGAFYPDYGALQQTALERKDAYLNFEAMLTKGQIQDMAEVDAFISSLDSIGTAELVEEAQRQMAAAK